jgi:hypothetical protein
MHGKLLYAVNDAPEKGFIGISVMENADMSRSGLAPTSHTPPPLP